LRSTARVASGACAQPNDGTSRRSSSIDAVAAPDGTFAAASASALSGSSARPVPSAMIANPNQIQLTSGLTVTV
jgi:hypothetical protein